MLRQFLKILYARRNPVGYARSLGVKVGQGCKLIDVSGRTFGSEPYLITLGDHVEFSGEVRFITHDGGAWVLRDQYPDLDVFGAIEVGDNVFIGHGATILPGTSIGDNCVIGARSLVKGVVDSDSVYAGVPARKIRTLAEYSARMREASLDTKRMPASRKKALLQDHFSATGGEVGRQV